MPRAFIISTGSELVSGSQKDTNSDFLMEELLEMGFEISGRIVVGDDRSCLEGAFGLGLELADLLVSTGGLGPTFDDLTREAACQAVGVPLEYRPEAAAEIEAFFMSLNRSMPESNRRQAFFPPGAESLKNHKGTAAGTYLEHQGHTIVLMPGPPREMETMFRLEVRPRLSATFGKALKKPFKRVVKIFGLGESQVEARVQDLLSTDHGLETGILAHNTEVMIKILARDEGQVATMNALAAQIAARMPGYAYSFEEGESLAAVIISLLRERGSSLALAESCTGGLTARLVTDVPGASDIFWGSVVSYSNLAKERCLAVEAATLESQGAVSEATAIQMARGVKALSGADWTLSITGIAGPGGGSEEKPVGLVYIACKGPEREQSKRFLFGGDRARIRNLAARSALAMLLRELNR